MARINVADRQIHCKIVYYGPGMAGKTTNLQYIYWQTPKTAKSDLLSIATETERTLFYHIFPSDFEKVRGFELCFHLYTVPGCTLYDRTRLNVLQGVDGVVFVADSQRNKLEENIKRLREVIMVLTQQNRTIPPFPFVLQYNKRDLGHALSVERMDYYLNPQQLPRFEAVADEGVGVMETFHSLAKMVVHRL
jgi:signal recognition particle receptor subunit beta